MSLTPAQFKAVQGLLTERNTAGAAVKAGVTFQAVNKWLKEPEFQNALADARNAVMAGVVAQLVGASAVAIERLHQLLDSPNTPLPILMQAVQVALGLAINETDKQQLMKRLQKLEALQSKGPSEPWEPAQLSDGNKVQ